LHPKEVVYLEIHANTYVTGKVEEKFEDTKEVIRIRKSKDSQKKKDKRPNKTPHRKLKIE